MPEMPRGTRLDSTLALLRDPYGFIARRSRRFQSEVFETRLLLRETICMTGPRAAELFYDEERFMRRGATPGRIQDTLFGRGGVQGLDGTAHRHRKHWTCTAPTTTPGRGTRRRSSGLSGSASGTAARTTSSPREGVTTP